MTVPLPAEMDVDPVRWAAGAALVNPHAAINVIKPDYSDDDSAPVFYKPSDRAWSK